MSKKYRLEIIYSEITEENFEIAHEIRERNLNGKIIESTENATHYTDFSNGAVLFFEYGIIKSWLTEIKEPLTRKEAWESFMARNISVDEFSPEVIYGSGWDDRSENQKLGVVDIGKDYQALEELINKTKDGKSVVPPSYIWNAALAYARGQS